MSKPSTLLERLQERETKLKAEIKNARKAEQKQNAANNAEVDRAYGAAIRAELKSNPEFSNTLRPIIDKHTKTTKARKLLGLSPRNNEA